MSDATSGRDQVRPLAAKSIIAKHPWWLFFLVALVPVVVVALPGSLTSVLAVDVDGFAVLAALLVAWACSAGEKAPRRSGRRLALFLTVIVVWMAGFLALDGTLRELVLTLPAVVFVAFAVAAVYSPTAALRDLARPLFRLRAESAAWTVALVAWPLLAALGVLIARAGIVHPEPLADQLGRVQFDRLLGILGNALFVALQIAFAWYGFAARRLLPRLSPLVTALIVGALPWLAWAVPLSFWLPAPSPFVLRSMLSAVVVSVVAVWVYRRSQGSLLPVVVFLVLTIGASSLVDFWVGSSYVYGESMSWLTLGLQGLLALALITQGRMWRRPDAVWPEPVAVAGGSDA